MDRIRFTSRPRAGVNFFAVLSHEMWNQIALQVVGFTELALNSLVTSSTDTFNSQVDHALYSLSPVRARILWTI
jgi:hypothetical protein